MLTCHTPGCSQIKSANASHELKHVNFFKEKGLTSLLNNLLVIRRFPWFVSAVVPGHALCEVNFGIIHQKWQAHFISCRKSTLLSNTKITIWKLTLMNFRVHNTKMKEYVFFRHVTRVTRTKKSESLQEIQPLTFRFHALALYHWAT